MSEWLPWIFGSICGFVAVLKILVGTYCIAMWWRASEFWGWDWLDIVWRLERDFGVSLTAADFADLSPDARWALTAIQLWELVGAKIRTSGRDVPVDGWERLVTALSEALNVKPVRVVADARLYADLRMERDMWRINTCHVVTGKHLTPDGCPRHFARWNRAGFMKRTWQHDRA